MTVASEAPSPSERRRFTVDEVLRMVDAGILEEDPGLELLDGELLLAPPEGPEHGYSCYILRDRLAQALGAGVCVRLNLPVDCGEHSLPQPDVSVVPGEPRDFAHRHPRADETALVVEVSRTTLARDHRKAAIYGRSGAPVYWLLDVGGRRLEVCTDPGPHGYGVVTILDEHHSAVVPGTSVTIRVGDLLV